MLLHFLVALRFLTIFSFGKNISDKSNVLARSMVFFPLVGFLIGIFSWELFVFTRSIFPERFSVFILIAGPVLFSGGLHVDGFSDFCDGFFGGKNKADILRIMKDPHIGSWAVVGVIFLMLAKFELLQALPGRNVFFLMAMVCSRWAQVALSFFLPYAGTGGGLGEMVARKIGRRELIGATLFLLPIFFWARIPGVIVFAALVVFLVLLGYFFHRRIGGITGDLLGATSELSELFVYGLATAVVR